MIKLSVIEKTYILIWFFYLLKCGEMMRVITFLVTDQGELVSLLGSPLMAPGLLL